MVWEYLCLYTCQYKFYIKCVRHTQETHKKFSCDSDKNYIDFDNRELKININSFYVCGLSCTL